MIYRLLVGDHGASSIFNTEEILMARNIVVCMDGTWNDPTERTNVYKLFHMLAGNEIEISEQGAIRSHLLKASQDLKAFYLEGVGANGRSQGVIGGSLGIGLHDRVIDAYLLVSQCYVEGDKIWVFGFSRGSWSARSLAGLIASAGLLENPSEKDAAQRAEIQWMEFKYQRAGATGDAYWAGKDQQPIRLVGVWDTVGALGIPLFNGLRAINQLERQLFDFADTNLSPRVQFGAHALSIDETRFDFTPTLWNARDGVEQVWFAGVHADVGGGYGHTGLSDLALQWMADRVNRLSARIQLDTAVLGSSFKPDPMQDRHDEARKTIWKLRPRRPRTLSADASLHPSVQTRLAGRKDYRPEALKTVAACAPFFAAGAVVLEEKLLPIKEILPTTHLDPGKSCDVDVFAQNWWNATGLEVRVGESYRIEASGSWIDRENKTEADGYASSSSILRVLEGSRRVETANWFALIAAIYGDPSLEARNPDSGNFVTGNMESLRKGVGDVDAKSQLTVVGRCALLETKVDGYLYLFANDSAFAYSNNSGFLSVRVLRET
jgi:uncharacterized protein (DUF2235 family)